MAGGYRYPGAAMFGVLAVWLQVSAVLQVLLAAFLVTLVLMHSGREAGMGGLGFTPHSQGGTHIVEQNLTRLTVVVASIFTLNTIVLFHLL
jgi:preprotein translocase subunit SecG